MIKRTCLLVDDSTQDEIVPTIIQEGIKQHIDIKCLQFNVGNPERRDLLTDEEIDLTKVIAVFKEEFKNEKIDLIAFDWNLSSSKVNGPLLIKHFNDNDIRKKIPKMLYSGILKDEIQKLCDNYRKNAGMPFKDIWNQVNTLIASGIITFVSRDHYEIAIVEQLKQIEDSVESTIEAELRKFPEFIFNPSFVNKSLQGKTFSEVAVILEGDAQMRNAFTKEVTQQVIAYLTETFPNA